MLVGGFFDFQDFWRLHRYVLWDSASILACFVAVKVDWPDYCFIEFSHIFHLFVCVVSDYFIADFVYTYESEAFKLYDGVWL